MHEDESKPCMGPTMLFQHGDIWTVLRLPLLGYVTIWMASIAKTPHMRCATGYVILNWASAISLFFTTILNECTGPFHTPTTYHFQGQEMPQHLIYTNPISTLLLCLVIWVGFVLYLGRVEAVEATALQSFKVKALRPVMAVCLPLIFLVSISLGLTRARFSWARFVYMGSAALLLVLWVVAVLIYCRALRVIMAAAGAAVKQAPAWMAPATMRVNRAMRSELLCLSISFATSVLAIIVMLVVILFKPEALEVPYKVVLLLDNVCNVAFALMLCGVFSGAQGAGRRAELARRRKASRAAALRSWTGKKLENGKNFLAWQEKIEELADRGISLSALLAFYRELPRRMPHFIPGRHSTSDVVFQAVIPMTRERMCSAAELLMNGVPTRPGTMVTHSWGTRFRDLVAGVLADAFGDSEYLFFSHLLDNEMPTLERWVESAGLGNRTYWICVFAVNQHRGICGIEEVDSVTGRRCPPCPCGLEKAWNHTEPTLSDGRSVPCEMNKFDDMMRLLASAQPSFSQIVCIDAAFTAFNRAWCIAEMATANELGMSQALKIGSAPQLAEHAEELTKLHIQDMQATRPEDKELILAAIEKPEEFDASMQRLIWEDLLPSWNSMDALERMSAAGRIIRWLGTEAFKDAHQLEETSVVSV